jgi:WD40 repeat protein
MRQSRLDWGSYSAVTVLENLKLRVFLQMSDGRVCGSAGHEVCIYDTDTSAIETAMEGHSDESRGIIQLEDGRICSCSSDKTIKVWTVESVLCELAIEYSVSYNN